MKNSIKMLLFFTFVLGIIYPIIVTGISQVFFTEKANGSFIYKEGVAIGSSLLAQKFVQEKYFWARPSSVEYEASSSGASNLAPTSKLLKEKIESRKLALNTLNDEMLASSASGLDPHISVKSALAQIPRILSARRLQSSNSNELEKIVFRNKKKKTLGFMGQERVNVLKLNLELDKDFSVE